MIVLLVTQILNAVFVPFIHQAGLALSVGLGACVNAAMLYFGLRKRGLYTPKSGWMSFILKLAVALILMGGLALVLSMQVDWLAMQSNRWLRAATMGGIIVACMVIYFGALFALGFRMRDFRKISR